MADIETGYLNGFELQMETIEDTFEVAVATYEYPYVDGADLEKMGQKVRPVKIRCYFYDGDQDNYDDHVNLINSLAMDHAGLDELVHPVYGTLKGYVTTVSVRADDRQRCAEVDITFLEQRRKTLEITILADVDQSVEITFLNSQDEQAVDLTTDIVGIFGYNPPFPTDIPSTSLLAEIGGQISAPARQFARGLQSRLAQFETLATEVTQPTNSLVATINYTADLPGKILGTITRMVEREAALFTSLRQFPARVTSSLSAAFGALEAELGKLPATPANLFCLKHVRIAHAQRLALEAAYSYADDQNRRETLAAQPPAFDTMGNYTPPPEVTPVANVLELESSLADARSSIQAVIQDNRSMKTLKTMARQLLEHVYTVKLEAPRMVAIQVDQPTPLHVICLRYGLPYSQAEQITRINRIPWASAVQGEVKIYV